MLPKQKEDSIWSRPVIVCLDNNYSVGQFNYVRKIWAIDGIHPGGTVLEWWDLPTAGTGTSTGNCGRMENIG